MIVSWALSTDNKQFLEARLGTIGFNSGQSQKRETELEVESLVEGVFHTDCMA